MSPTHKNGYLQRLFNTQRKYMTTKVRKAQTKRQHKKITRTNAEKAIRYQQRSKFRETLSNDIKEARKVIMAEAVKLHQKHGGHNIDYYVKLLYQEGRCKSKRKVSDWNAWVRLESQRLNEGKLYSLFSSYSYNFFDRFTGWRTSQGSRNHSHSQANVAQDVLR